MAAPSVDDEYAAYEMKLLLSFGALLVVLVLANLAVWQSAGATLSAVYVHPEAFEIEGDAALIAHVNVGVEYKMAGAQAAADAEADSIETRSPFVDGSLGTGALPPRGLDFPEVGAPQSPVRSSRGPQQSRRTLSPPPSALGREQDLKWFRASLDGAAVASRRGSLDGRSDGPHMPSPLDVAPSLSWEGGAYPRGRAEPADEGETPRGEGEPSPDPGDAGGRDAEDKDNPPPAAQEFSSRAATPLRRRVVDLKGPLS
jgi:hypothetical protein